MAYQVITYDRETGVDEKMEYTRRAEAAARARRESYFNPKGYGTAEGVIVYDLKHGKITDIFGHFPERYRPTEQ